MRRTDCSSAPRVRPLPEYEHALRRLYSLGQGRMLPGRERLARLLERAGNPHLAVPAILVGGTNGKGSLVTALSAVLSHGLRCGAFVKPHLKSIRERWRLDDQPVPEPLFLHYLNQTLELIDSNEEEISFFEANVLLAALLFSGEGCGAAVWEVGLGGAEDACNLVQPEVSVITNVGYDHQAILGNTLAEIARDKAGIARPGMPLLLGPPRSGWEKDYAEYEPVIRAYAESIGADYTPLEWRELYEPFVHERMPADTLLLLEETLLRFPPAGGLDSMHFRGGLYNWHYRGRMERTELHGWPVLLDAAHNADSLRWLRISLEKQIAEGQGSGGFPLIFGCQVSRDPAEMLAELRPVISALVPIEIPVLRPCPLGRIVEAAEALGIAVSLPPGLSPDSSACEYEIGHITELDPPDNCTQWIESVEHGLSLGSAERPAVICGSIYNLGEILRVFEDGASAWQAD